jgi:hypothetical protein
VATAEWPSKCFPIAPSFGDSITEQSPKEEISSWFELCALALLIRITLNCFLLPVAKSLQEEEDVIYRFSLGKYIEGMDI